MMKAPGSLSFNKAIAWSREISGLYQYLEVSCTNLTFARVSGLLSGIENLEKSGNVWVNAIVLPLLGLDIPLDMGEGAFPLRVE